MIELVRRFVIPGLAAALLIELVAFGLALLVARPDPAGASALEPCAFPRPSINAAVCEGPLRVVWRNLPTETPYVRIEARYVHDESFEFTVPSQATPFVLPAYAQPDGDGPEIAQRRFKGYGIRVLVPTPDGDRGIGGVHANRE